MSKQIIIIDDMPFVADLFKDICIEAGYEDAKCYNDPMVAVSEIIKGEKPGFVLADYQMPGMNGVEALMEIEKTFPNVPAAIMTSEPGKVKFSGRDYPVFEKSSAFQQFLPEYLKVLVDCIEKEKAEEFKSSSKETDQDVGGESQKGAMDQKQNLYRITTLRIRVKDMIRFIRLGTRFFIGNYTLTYEKVFLGGLDVFERMSDSELLDYIGKAEI